MNGQLFVVSAPSGAGKTTLTRALSSVDDRLSVSVSHTTRPQRPAELDGVDYHFVSPREFAHMRDQGKFLETATVFEHQYGTARASIESKFRANLDVVLDIDWQGARQVRETGFPNCSIFLLPPSLDALQERLQKRAQDTQETIEYRMSGALHELEHYKEFDFLVINDHRDLAIQTLLSIVQSLRNNAIPKVPDVRSHAENLVKNRLSASLND